MFLKCVISKVQKLQNHKMYLMFLETKIHYIMSDSSEGEKSHICSLITEVIDIFIYITSLEPP